MNGRRVLLFALVATLCAPAAASAATFCVGKPACVSAGGTVQPGVQPALDAAAANGAGADRVEIGPGTWANGVSETFVNAAGSTVAIVGSGDATILTTGGSAPGGAKVLTVSEPASTVSDLRIVTPGSSVQFPVGLDLAGTAERVAIEAPADSDPQIGVSLQSGSLFRRGRIELLGPTGLSGNGAVGLGTIEDSTIVAASGSAAGVTRRVRIRARTGLLGFGGDTLVDQALVELAAENGAGVLAGGSTGSATMTVTGVTVVGGGSGRGFVAEGFPIIGSNTNTLIVSDSIARGVAVSAERKGTTFMTDTTTANLTLRYSSYDQSTVTESGDGTLTVGPGNVDDVDARFRGADDYRLAADSPLIDAGDPDPAAAGESTTDLDGAARFTDRNGDGPGRRDMGAFEYNGEPVAPVTPGTPAGGGEPADTGGGEPADTVEGQPADLADGEPAADGRRCARSRESRGSSDFETLRAATSFGDRLLGLGGRDLLIGGLGADCLFGGVGDDVLRGRAGSDRLLGGRGDDLLRGDSGADRLAGGSGRDRLIGGGGRDRLAGGSGRDRLIGGGGRDRFAGGSGRDRLIGGGGRDRFAGGPGADRIGARDGVRERVDCGPGRGDFARVDRRDRVRRCERISRRGRR